MVLHFEDLSPWWLRHVPVVCKRNENRISRDGCVRSTLRPVLRIRVWRAPAQAAVSRWDFCGGTCRSQPGRTRGGRNRRVSLAPWGLFQTDAPVPTPQPPSPAGSRPALASEVCRRPPHEEDAMRGDRQALSQISSHCLVSLK